MSRILSIEHRRGTTFSWAGTATLPAGTWTAASALEKNDGTAVAALTVTLTPLGTPGPSGETHALVLEASAAAQAAWPIGTLVGDIVFTEAAGLVLATSRFTVAVVRGVTNAD